MATYDDLKLDIDESILDDKKWEESYKEEDLPIIQKKEESTGYKKWGGFNVLNDIGDIFGKAVDIRNKLVYGPQNPQPVPGVNYQPQPQAKQPAQKSKLPIIAGGAMVVLAGVLIYQKTKGG